MYLPKENGRSFDYGGKSAAFAQDDASLGGTKIGSKVA